MQLNLPVIVLLIVFVLIAVRQVAGIRLKIWQIVLGGALAVLLTLQITPVDAFESIDLDVIFFLLGMFIVGQALYQSGYLFHIANRIFHKAKNMDQLVLFILFSAGLLSAFLMNDTLAIIGTPLVLYYATRNRASPKLLLLTLAFAVTIGSVMSPIGNPQNLLIALHGGIADPFAVFFIDLFIPTIINLFIAYLLLKLYYRKEFQSKQINIGTTEINDPKLARLCKCSLILIFLMIIVKIALVAMSPNIDFPLTYIAIGAALPILLFSPRRFEMLRKVDWSTLVFFASLFVLVGAVWDTGFFQDLIKGFGGVTSISMVLLISVVFSQFISNVPFVMLYLPLLMGAGVSTNGLLALAAGSTMAGGLFILGAASNIIIIQNAEKEGQTLTFFEFAKIGIPLTILCCCVYWLFLAML